MRPIKSRIRSLLGVKKDMKPNVHHFKIDLTHQVSLDYLLFLPKGYKETGEQQWPLILFLHGAGERGYDATEVMNTAIKELLANQTTSPFILLAPQCPPDTWWVEKEGALIALLDSITGTHAVDESRVYLTGLSMGGAGSWYLASKHPKRFAALAPICGASLWWQGFPQNAALLKDIPIWAFHGDADDVVPITVTEEIVAVLQENQADVQLTRYPGVAHNSWAQTYANPALYEWLFEHQL